MQQTLTQLADTLLQLSDRALDPVAKDLIRKWRDDPTPKAILHTLDVIVNGGLASAFEVNALDIMFGLACDAQGVSKQSVIDAVRAKPGRLS